MPRARAAHVRVKRLSVFAVTVVACFTAGASCSSSEPGLEVEVALEAPASPELESGARQFSSDLGYEVTLTRGYLAVGSVELVPCKASAAQGFGLPFGVGVARAHSLSSPTRLGEPGVVSLAGAAEAELVLGTLKPPPDDYCELEMGLAPADDDAARLPSDLEFSGLTLYLEGSYQKGTGAPIDFSASTDLALDAQAAMAHLTLDDGSSSPTRLAVSSHGEHWFDGVDFAAATSDEIAESVLENVKASLTVSSR